MGASDGVLDYGLAARESSAYSQLIDGIDWNARASGDLGYRCNRLHTKKVA
jgi:hypothetical protein